MREVFMSAHPSAWISTRPRSFALQSPVCSGTSPTALLRLWGGEERESSPSSWEPKVSPTKQRERPEIQDWTFVSFAACPRVSLLFFPRLSPSVSGAERTEKDPCRSLGASCRADCGRNERGSCGVWTAGMHIPGCPEYLCRCCVVSFSSLLSREPPLTSSFRRKPHTRAER